MVEELRSFLEAISEIPGISADGTTVLVLVRTLLLELGFGILVQDLGGSVLGGASMRHFHGISSGFIMIGVEKGWQWMVGRLPTVEES
jgi:hypothetical protein